MPKRERGKKSPCMYCGDPANTVEHIIATWIIDVLSQDPRGLRLPTKFSWTDPRSREVRRMVGKTTKKGKPTLEFTTQVCSECNSGWMNNIDKAVRPALTSMIRGADTELTEVDQAAVATWATKVTLTARHAYVTPAHIEKEWTDYLHSHKTALPFWNVWIARYRGRWPIHYAPDDVSVRLLPGPPGVYPSPAVIAGPPGPVLFEHGVMATLAIGYLLVQVFGFSGEAEPVVPDPAMIQRIWPKASSPTLLRWPAAPDIDDSTLQRLTDRLKPPR